MTTIPILNAISDVPDQDAAQAVFEQFRAFVGEMLGGGPETELTVAGGAVTPTGSTHTIDTEFDAPTDDLDTIHQTNRQDGSYLWLRNNNGARVTTIRNNQGGAGKVLLTDGVNFVLNSTKKSILLKRVGNNWEEVDRFYGDKLEEMRAWLQLEPDTVSTGADRNITAADRGKVITLTGVTPRAFTFTATPAALGDGWSCYVRNASTADLTIIPASGLMVGVASYVLKSGETIELCSDATNMDMVGGKLLWRERLTSNLTLYVATTGNDANSGRTIGSPFATIQRAWNVIHQTLDLAGFSVAVQLADGAYTSGLNAVGAISGQSATSSVTFQGNNATPGNVLINVTGGPAINIASGARVTIRDLELRTTTSGDCVDILNHGFFAWSNLRFGACAGFHINVFGQGRAEAIGNYTISGGAQRHFNATTLGFIQVQGRTVTLSGTPAFSSMFARASNAGVLYVPSNTWSGAATGQRYAVLQAGVIDTEGAGPNYFPGNVAGAVTAPGVYG